MRQVPRLFLPLVPLTLIVWGCATLPDVKPFAESTAALAAAAGAQYHDVSNDVASLQEPRVPGDSEDTYAQRRSLLQDTQKVFAATDKSLDALFDAMTAYSEKLASLAAAGKTGPDAAQSLLDSAKGFADLAGISIPVAGPVADVITKGFKAIADEFTKVQAKRSLAAAADAAQPGVDLIAKQFEVIYAVAIKDASDGIRNSKRLQASIAAGPSVIGFSDNVKRNYTAYYRFLNEFVTDANPADAGSAWRGLCRERTGPCRARNELDAVGLVEARMVAIHPIVAAFEAEVTSIDDTLSHRRKASAAVIKAVDAWALEHQKVRRSLKDGTSSSALNLRAALTELQGVVSQR